MNTYELGQMVKLTAVFTDPEDDEAPIDPDVVKLSYRSPSSTLTTLIYGTDPEITKPSVGSYSAVIEPDEAGTWYYRWWSTGDGQAANEYQFEVQEAFAV